MIRGSCIDDRSMLISHAASVVEDHRTYNYRIELRAHDEPSFLVVKFAQVLFARASRVHASRVNLSGKDEQTIRTKSQIMQLGGHESHLIVTMSLEDIKDGSNVFELGHTGTCCSCVNPWKR